MSHGPLNNQADELAGIFRNTSMHSQVVNIIRDHLADRADIREEALAGIDFPGIARVLDLGCGAGFFTEALAGKLSRRAEVTGMDLHENYREIFLSALNKQGITAWFISNGIDEIKYIADHTFDLVTCAYALYYFPEYISQVSRVLNEKGVFVVITHSSPHLKELTHLVKEILEIEHIPYDGLLPYERLINRFCNSNGHDLLSPFFGSIEIKEIKNEMVFDSAGFINFAEYFRFKLPFFIPRGIEDERNLTRKILDAAKARIDFEGCFRITKNDVIFICSQPKENDET